MSEAYRHMDVTEVAAAYRQDLKAAFPGVKFRVRTSRYSMGSSVSVEWTDGPSLAQVKVITDPLDHYRFDGMQDLAWTAEAVTYRGERVRAGCHVSHVRHYTRAAVEAFIAGIDEPGVETLRIAGTDDHAYVADLFTHGDTPLADAVMEARSAYTTFPDAPVSAQETEASAPTTPEPQGPITMTAQELQDAEDAVRAEFGGLLPAQLIEDALRITAREVTVVPEDGPVWIDAETVPLKRGLLN